MATNCAFEFLLYLLKFLYLSDQYQFFKFGLQTLFVVWDDTKVVCKESRWSHRKWKEAWIMENEKSAIANRDNGRTLPEVFRTLIDKD